MKEVAVVFDEPREGYRIKYGFGSERGIEKVLIVRYTKKTLTILTQWMDNPPEQERRAWRSDGERYFLEWEEAAAVLDADLKAGIRQAQGKITRLSKLQQQLWAEMKRRKLEKTHA